MSLSLSWHHRSDGVPNANSNCPSSALLASSATRPRSEKVSGEPERAVGRPGAARARRERACQGRPRFSYFSFEVESGVKKGKRRERFFPLRFSSLSLFLFSLHFDSRLAHAPDNSAFFLSSSQIERERLDLSLARPRAKRESDPEPPRESSEQNHFLFFVDATRKRNSFALLLHASASAAARRPLGPSPSPRRRHEADGARKPPRQREDHRGGRGGRQRRGEEVRSRRSNGCQSRARRRRHRRSTSTSTST